MENLEILKNIKDYMQWCIDRGYHKFTYNDLGWDFKCIDAINLIDDVLNHITKQEKMIELMAEHISFGKDIQKILCSPKVHRKDGCIGITCKRCIKQYFEKKAKEAE